MAVQCSTETMAEKKEYKSVIRPRAHAQGKNTVQTSDSGARKLTTELPEVIYKQRPGNKGSQCLECRNGMIQIGCPGGPLSTQDGQQHMAGSVYGWQLMSLRRLPKKQGTKEDIPCYYLEKK